MCDYEKIEIRLLSMSPEICDVHWTQISKSNWIDITGREEKTVRQQSWEVEEWLSDGEEKKLHKTIDSCHTLQCQWEFNSVSDSRLESHVHLNFIKICQFSHISLSFATRGKPSKQ